MENRYYSDRDNIKYVLKNLDRDLWAKAISKIESQLDAIYTDEHNPKPFPSQLRLTSDLGI